MQEGRTLRAFDVGARRDSHPLFPDNAALYAATPCKPATVSVRMGSPRAHFRIAWRRVRSAVRNRDNDVADARWRISLAAFRQWLWSSQDPRRKYRSSATG